MRNEETIKQLLDAIGGVDNIKNFEHCATRLRIIVKDDQKVPTAGRTRTGITRQ